MMPSLIIDHLSIDLRSGTGNLVSEISFAIKEGESLILLGQSGSGKTMTCSAVLNLLDPKKFKVSGSVFFGETDLLNSSEKQALLTKSRSAPPCQQKKTPTGVIQRVLSSVSGLMRSPTRGSGPPLPLSLVAKRALSCARASARKTSPRTRPAAASAPLDKQARSGAPSCAAGLPRSS